jgi:hypothetical protein
MVKSCFILNFILGGPFGLTNIVGGGHGIIGLDADEN